MRGGGLSIKGFIESSFLDWPGRVASVAFLPGCNFRCPFCHNHPLVLKPEAVEDIPLAYVLESLRENGGWVDGVVVTGGEPTVYPGLEVLVESFRSEGLAVKLDTNGSNPAVMKRLIDRKLLDAVAMDIKAPLTGKAYEAATGVSLDVSGIRQSIEVLRDSTVEVYFRATVVPGLHDEDAVRSMAGELYGRPLIIQNFEPEDALDPAYRRIVPFGAEGLRRLRAAAGHA